MPAWVQQECEIFLKCGRLEHRFLRVRCEACKQEYLVVFSTFIRRACSALNRDVHFPPQ